MTRPVAADTPQDWFWCARCTGITQHRKNVHALGERVWRCRWCKAWNKDATTLEDHIAMSSLLDV